MNSTSHKAFAKTNALTAETLNEATADGMRILERFNRAPKVPTAFLQPTFNAHLADQGIGPVLEAEPRLALPNWDPAPGGVDVVVTTDDGRVPRFLAELKMRDTDQMFWDLFKMIDALNMPGVEATYLAIGATDRQWSKTSEACTEIFRESGPGEFSTIELFANNAVSWWYLLWDSTGRPTSLPARFAAEIVSIDPLEADGRPGSLRCIAVEAVGSDRLEFSDNWFHGNWPHEVVPPQRYRDQPPRTGTAGRFIPSVRARPGKRRSG